MLYDSLSAFELVINTMKGIPSETRLAVIEQAVNFNRNSSLNKESENVVYLVKKMRLIVGFRDIIEEKCRIDFMYWTQELIVSILEYFYNNNQQIYMSQTYIDGLCDSIYLFENSGNASVGD